MIYISTLSVARISASFSKSSFITPMLPACQSRVDKEQGGVKKLAVDLYSDNIAAEKTPECDHMTAINIIDDRHDQHLGSNMYWGATIFHLEVGVCAGLEQHPGFGGWVGVSIIAHHHSYCL